MAHNPSTAPLFEYEVRQGRRFGKNKEFGPGDTVVLTEFEARGVRDTLRKVGPATRETDDASRAEPTLPALVDILDDKTVDEVLAYVDSGDAEADGYSIRKVLHVEKNNQNRKGVVEPLTEQLAEAE